MAVEPLDAGPDSARAEVAEAWERLEAARAAVQKAQRDVQEAVLAAFGAGLSGRQLAEALGVTPARVYQIRRGSWARGSGSGVVVEAQGLEPPARVGGGGDRDDGEQHHRGTEPDGRLDVQPLGGVSQHPLHDRE